MLLGFSLISDDDDVFSAEKSPMNRQVTKILSTPNTSFFLFLNKKISWCLIFLLSKFTLRHKKTLFICKTNFFIQFIIWFFYTIYYMIFLKLCTVNTVQNNSTFIILVIFFFFCGLSQVPYPDNFEKTNFLVTSFLYIELLTGIWSWMKRSFWPWRSKRRSR